MLLRLRVSLPDRPGVLGQVARAFGVMGADILQVTVLERESGRAVDDFTVSWSAIFSAAELSERISVVPGVRVEAAWPTRELPGANPDYDLLGHIAADPARAVLTLVDAVPDLVSAEWAVALEAASGEVVHGSWQAPEAVPAPQQISVRPAAFSEGTLHLASVPFDTVHLLVARRQGPAFHRAELDRVARLVDVVSVLAHAGVSRA
ncbi:amino acid-binding protein [Acrocarpospora catenulata]|uniref:amino acid-binding protein n=1 Tax=Acrocarpospora catenulata TaxID=2836182 RepID=UPI001BD973F6|nr:amino acid-binding protein [Acrocarpospora catenulata]